MANNTTYNPNNITEFNKKALQFNGIGVSAVAIAGYSTNIDYKITDDMLITGAQVLTDISTFGDSLSFQVIDIDNIFGYGANLIINQFVSNWQMKSDSQEQINLQVNYPSKIPAGLYLRSIYVSTGPSDVKISINYTLHKVII